MRKTPPRISARELEVLKLLWSAGPSTGPAIHSMLRSEGRAGAYTTVKTYLDRLLAKGFVTKDESGGAHLFSARISQQEWAEGRVNELVGELPGPDVLPIARALAGDIRLTAKERSELRNLIHRLTADAREPGS